MMRKTYNLSLLFSLILSGLLMTSCASRGGPERYYFGDYSEAERLYTKGEYETAIQKYQSYLENNPEGNLAVIALYYIGKSHAAMGHADQAKDVYQKIIKEYPDLVWADFAENQLKEMASPTPFAGTSAQS